MKAESTPAEQSQTQYVKLTDYEKMLVRDASQEAQTELRQPAMWQSS